MRQPAFPGLEPAPALTERQAFAARVIRERGPIRSDDLGAWLCERNLRHSHLQTCPYDGQNGRGVAEALRRKGLVRYRRGQGWVVEGWAPEREAAGRAWTTAEIPF